MELLALLEDVVCEEKHDSAATATTKKDELSCSFGMEAKVIVL